MFKGQSEENVTSNLLLIFNGLYLAITGIAFLAAESFPETGETYQLMTKFITLDAWGVVMITGGIFYLAATVQGGKGRFVSMTLGGAIGGLIFALYASASYEASYHLMNPIRYGLIACTHLIVSLIGGVSAWRIKRILLRELDYLKQSKK